MKKKIKDKTESCCEVPDCTLHRRNIFEKEKTGNVLASINLSAEDDCKGCVHFSGGKPIVKEDEYTREEIVEIPKILLEHLSEIKNELKNSRGKTRRKLVEDIINAIELLKL